MNCIFCIDGEGTPFHNLTSKYWQVWCPLCGARGCKFADDDPEAERDAVEQWEDLLERLSNEPHE